MLNLASGIVYTVSGALATASVGLGIPAAITGFFTGLRSLYLDAQAFKEVRARAGGDCLDGSNIEALSTASPLQSVLHPVLACPPHPTPPTQPPLRHLPHPAWALLPGLLPQGGKDGKDTPLLTGALDFLDKFNTIKVTRGGEARPGQVPHQPARGKLAMPVHRLCTITWALRVLVGPMPVTPGHAQGTTSGGREGGWVGRGGRGRGATAAAYAGREVRGFLTFATVVHERSRAFVKG